MIKKTKILIVENSRADVELIEYELKKAGIDFVIEVVQTEQAYGESLKTFAPDIILSDYSFPSFDGEMAFRRRLLS